MSAGNILVMLMSPWYWAKQTETLPVKSSFQAILDNIIRYKVLASGYNATDPFWGAHNAPQTPSWLNDAFNVIPHNGANAQLHGECFWPNF